MPIPKSFIDELKAKNPIESVIGAHVQLKRAGRNLTGLCPFHSERTPSFSVNSAEGYYHCFGCGAGGDVITFVANYERLDPIEAIKFLAERSGMTMPESDGREEQFARLKTRILAANRDAAKFFNKTLTTAANAEKARRYVLERGLTPATVAKYGIGFADSEWESLTRHLRGLGYTDEELQAARLVAGKNGKIFDFFRDRLMFPIIDLRGNVIGFGGRVIDGEGPKYINTPENPVFIKGRNLYSLQIAKKTEADSIILCEGYMDVIALGQAGFENSVAGLGTALTAEQARLLSGYANEVYISYDSDEAGKKAAARAISILSDVGIRTKILEIKGAKDPDEYIKKFGADAFGGVLREAGNATDFRLAKLEDGLDLNDNTDKVTYLDKAAKIIAELPSKHIIIYSSELADKLRIPLERVRSLVDDYVKKNKKSKENEQWHSIEQSIIRHSVSDTKFETAEKKIWGYLYRNPEIGRFIAENLTEESFSAELSKQIYIKLTKCLSENVEFDILSECDPSMQGKITEIMTITDLVSVTREEFESWVEIIKNKAKPASEIDNEDLRNIFKS
jgi:DNA primase